MLDYKHYKCLFSDFWQILKERRDQVFGLIQANSIYNSALLIVLPLSKAAHVARLD